MPEDKYYLKGVELYKSGKYHPAIKKFNNTIKDNPSFELAWRHKAKAHYALKPLHISLNS